jgi:hypothetical protein
VSSREGPRYFFHSSTAAARLARSPPSPDTSLSAAREVASTLASEVAGIKAGGTPDQCGIGRAVGLRRGSPSWLRARSTGSRLVGSNSDGEGALVVEPAPPRVLPAVAPDRAPPWPPTLLDVASRSVRAWLPTSGLDDLPFMRDLQCERFGSSREEATELGRRRLLAPDRHVR